MHSFPLSARRLLLTMVLGTLTFASVCVAAAGATGTPAKCGSSRVPAFYSSITKITASHVSCTTAKKVAQGYVRAISSSTNVSTGDTHQGACYPGASYGLCGFPAAGNLWNCFRPHPSRAHPAPATRCELGLSDRVVHFNWL